MLASIAPTNRASSNCRTPPAVPPPATQSLFTQTSVPGQFSFVAHGMSFVLTMHAELRFWPSAHREPSAAWRCRWVAREHAPVPPTAAERRHLEALRGGGPSLESALRQLTHCGVAE